jgi:hypothetical protein
MSGQATDLVTPMACDSGSHAEAVRHADAQMDAERGRRHQPAIKSRFRDDSFSAQKSGRRARKAMALLNRCHVFPPCRDFEGFRRAADHAA